MGYQMDLRLTGLKYGYTFDIVLTTLKIWA